VGRIQQQRGRRGADMRAARQGTFDGLCGVYAILNALDPAGLRLPRGALHAELFEELTYSLGAVSLLSAMHYGLERDDLLRAARCAFRWLSTEHGIEMVVSAPYEDTSFETIDDFVRELRAQLRAGGKGLIVYVALPTRNHWTVPVQLVGDAMHLRDSSGLRTLPIPRSRRGGGSWRLSPADTLVIQRIGG
jgi:hypothetical protein